MLLRIFLRGLLLIAGLVHLVRPDLFFQAMPFPQKLLLNYAAGVWEILLALGLWHPRSRDHAARGAALWFLILTPIHVYVSLKGIAIFGVSDPFWLWIRTALQAPLIFMALSLQDRGWIISQRWSDVLFLHYEVDVQELQKLVPYPLDLFEGKAVVGIVPFVMGHIRFPFLPAIPGLSKLFELNLRTYVLIAGRPAVYFLTLDSNHLPGVLIARTFFGLPYRWRSMRLKHKELYRFESAAFKLEAKINQTPATSEFDLWATERYALVTRVFGMDLIGVVEHEPWKLTKAELLKIQDDFIATLGVTKIASSPMAVSYARELTVRFRPFRKLK